MGKSEQAAKTHKGQKLGKKAVVTVEYSDAGNFEMSLDCPSEIKDGQPTVVAEAGNGWL